MLPHTLSVLLYPKHLYPKLCHAASAQALFAHALDECAVVRRPLQIADPNALASRYNSTPSSNGTPQLMQDASPSPTPYIRRRCPTTAADHALSCHLQYHMLIPPSPLPPPLRPLPPPLCMKLHSHTTSCWPTKGDIQKSDAWHTNMLMHVSSVVSSCSYTVKPKLNAEPRSITLHEVAAFLPVLVSSWKNEATSREAHCNA